METDANKDFIGNTVLSQPIIDQVREAMIEYSGSIKTNITHTITFIQSIYEIKLTPILQYFNITMIALEPVTKYRKQAFSKNQKERERNKSQQTIPINLGQRVTPQQAFNIADTLKQQIYQQRQFEDSRLTKFIHEKLIVTKLLLTFLAMISILISLMQASIPFRAFRKLAIFGVHSAISVIMVMLIFLKYKITAQLRQKQLIKKQKSNPIIQSLRNEWFQAILLIIHPNILTKDIVMHISQPVFDQTMPLQLNDLFQIIMLTRIYLLFDWIISSSIYCSTRASRMCRMYNTKDPISFGRKSFFNTYPLHTLLILYVSLVIVFSRMLNLAEMVNPYFHSFEDFIWCIIITMGTIGYGDHYPSAYIGRLIAFLAALSGIIWNSLLILTLSEYLSMSSSQYRSNITLQRLQLRKILQQYAQQAIAQTSELGGKGVLQKLKKKSERVKLTMRRLKNTIDCNNLNQEIRNLFQSLYGNLMEIYINQQAYAEQLQKTYKKQAESIQESGFTFAGEIERVIKDR